MKTCDCGDHLPYVHTEVLVSMPDRSLRSVYTWREGLGDCPCRFCVGVRPHNVKSRPVNTPFTV